ncbi:hypothetical protein V6000_006657 [Aspergillus fumigatus]
MINKGSMTAEMPADDGITSGRVRRVVGEIMSYSQCIEEKQELSIPTSLDSTNIQEVTEEGQEEINSSNLISYQFFNNETVTYVARRQTWFPVFCRLSICGICQAVCRRLIYPNIMNEA